MKKTLNVLFATVLTMALFVQCDSCKKTDYGKIKDPKLKELYDVLSDIPDNQVFAKLRNCDECINKDSEVGIILTVKDSLDAALKSLRLFAEYENESADKSGSDVFTKKIIKINDLSGSVHGATNASLAHFIYLQTLNNQKSNSYDISKNALLSTDSKFKSMEDTLVSVLTKHLNQEQSFNNCLNRINDKVSDSDLESAAKELEEEEFPFLLSCAKMLKSLYEFEVMWARSVKELLEM